MTKLSSRNEYFRNNPWVKQTLERDGGFCVDCGVYGAFLVVHHIDESRKNGWRSMNNDLSNLISLCKPCHAARHKQTLKFVNPNYALILELRDNGQTYQQIGDYIGISRQRVHQIIKRDKEMP